MAPLVGAQSWPHDIASPQLQVLRNQRVGSTRSVATRRTGILDGDLHREVVRTLLGVVHADDPVPRRVEDARVEQFVLRLGLGRGRRWWRRGPRRGTPPGDSGSATSSTSAWAWRRCTTSTPSRPHRGCPGDPSGRTSAPSRWGPRRSTVRGRGTSSGRGRKSPPCRLRSSDRPDCARGRGGTTPTRRRRRCSPRARNPRRVRRGTGPQSRQALGTIIRRGESTTLRIVVARGHRPVVPSRCRHSRPRIATQ